MGENKILQVAFGVVLGAVFLAILAGVPMWGYHTWQNYVAEKKRGRECASQRLHDEWRKMGLLEEDGRERIKGCRDD